MSKPTYSTLHWFVTYYNYNADSIEHYDILKYRMDFMKKIKKQSQTKEDFAEKLRKEMRWAFRSKSEWELIIEFDENGRVWLNPWVGSRHPEEARIDVTNSTDFDWFGFAKQHITHKNTEKIDVFDQLDYCWDKFVDYCWYTRLRYERNHPKFNK
jgi:hypothetical protein